MLIEEEALRHWIDNFYGYGSWHARFWFVGYEEGGGELPEEVADKLNYFRAVDAQTDGALCDIRELYKHVAVRWDGPKASSFNSLYDYRFTENAALHGTWKNLVAFVHGYKNQSLPDLLLYQQQAFVSPVTHTEALIQLYPLPSPHSHAWYYSWLDLPRLSFLKSRALYEQQLYERRIQCILSNIRKYQPDVVLMYGMTNINTLKQSVGNFFPGTKFRMINATAAMGGGRQIPQHHRADLDGTTMLITTQIPALRHNRIETGFDWEAFGGRIKSETGS